MNDMLLKSSRMPVETVSHKSTPSARQMQQGVTSSNPYSKVEKLKPEVELIEPETEYTEPIYKEPVDLVYLWVNGSDPRFLLDLKRQKALEDAKLYKSPLVCTKSYGSNVSIPVIVVYPAMLQPSKVQGNDKVRLVFNVTDKELAYTVIIPKQGGKASEITNILTKIDGQTYICMCGYITNKVNRLAKKTLDNLYLVHSKKNQHSEISENLKQVELITQNEENNGTDIYTLVYDNNNYFHGKKGNMTRLDFQTEPAVLVWDSQSIHSTGLPNRNRFEDNDQLLYSLRSVEKYASWIQHIFIITNNQVPSWLNISKPRISVISTEEIFPNMDDLPSFSSPAMESHMHRIQELSETFLFMCDDFFFGKPIKLSDFYTAEEGLKLYWDGRIANCAFGCTHLNLGNGKCDKSCDNLRCGWDQGDCRPIQHEQTKLKHPIGLHYGSLFHTMAIFNRKFNYNKIYRMPPHAPLLVNKKVAIDLENSFHEEFKKSSTLHFRSQFNIQYTMAYYEFVSSARVIMTTEEIFNKLDEDKSGTFSYEELKRFRNMPRGGELFLDATAMNQTGRCLEILKDDFAMNGTSRHTEGNMTRVLIPEFTRCITDAIKRAKITRPKYKHKIDKSKDRYFIMIRSDIRHAQKDFAKVLHQPRKFNAVNDDMDHSKKETIAVKRALKQFYEKLFPKPSQFEFVDS